MGLHIANLLFGPLLAMTLISRIRSVFATELDIRALYQAPTVDALAERLGTAHDARPPVRRRGGANLPPLSYAQQRLWFLDRLEGAGPTYTVPLVFRLR